MTNILIYSQRSAVKNQVCLTMRSKADLLTGMQGVNQNDFYIAGENVLKSLKAKN
jgi:hypothetical protein